MAEWPRGQAFDGVAEDVEAVGGDDRPGQGTERRRVEDAQNWPQPRMGDAGLGFHFQAFSSLDMDWAAGIVAFGAVVATTAVLLVFQLGQPRIFFAMARDGLLPKRFARVHPRYQTPHVTTILTGVVVAFFAAFMDIGEAAELTNIGTLFAFILVCAGVIILRWRQPELNRPFRCPWVPVIPVLGMLICFHLMLSLPWVTWIRFFVWLGIGMVIYLCYSRRHSNLATQSK